MSLFLMPNIFVIPPEEDDDSPFCCFDAADPLEHSPTEADLEGPGSALEIISRLSNNYSPIFHRDSQSRDIVMPRRNDGRSIVSEEDLYGVDDPDITIRGGSAPGDDSEIIEVVKVRRHTEKERISQQAPPPPSVSEPNFKRSKTFKSRASRAFNSIKNVGRSTSRSRITAEDVFMDAEDSKSSSRAPSPAPSRRGSMIFSSLFSHPPSIRSRSSFDSFNEPTTSSPLEASSSAPLGISIHAPSSSEMQGFVPSPDTDDENEEDIQTTPRATLPAASDPQPRNRRRFSVLNLFTASKEVSSPETSPMSLPSTPTLPSLSDSLGPSRTDSTESTASSGPATPIDDVFPDHPSSRPSTSSLLKRLPSFSRTPKKRRQDDVAPVPVVAPKVASSRDEVNEPSFGEIRLDSLHFDEMSFDATRF